MSAKKPEERQHMEKIPYASAIGSLMHAILCARPKITYDVSVISRYQSDIGLEHWTTVKCILKYLRKIKDLLLIYREGDL